MNQKSNYYIKVLSDKKDLEDFCNFPFEIYKNNKFWVPPFIKDEIESLQKKYNPAFDYCDTKFWLVFKNNKIAGRIGCIINHKYNEEKKEKMGRFTRLEFIDDYKVSELLISTACEWLKEKKMLNIQGPLGFSNLDQQGMLIEGFEHIAAMASCYHLPYYKEHLKELGFIKEIDWIESMFFLDKIPEKAIKFSKIIKERYNLKVIKFKSVNDVLSYSKKIFNLLNETYQELHGMTSLNEKIKKYYTDKFLKYVNPDFVTVIENDKNEVIAYIIGSPSLSVGLQKSKGRLFPFGWYWLMKEKRYSKTGELLLGSVRKDFQGKGIIALLITCLHKAFDNYGIKKVESTAVLENNNKMLQSMKMFETIQHKRKRCWKKYL